MNKHISLSFPGEIVIGKDILELVSSAMYVEPLTIYREYVQNAADSIDDAKLTGVLVANEPGRVDIGIDPVSRVVKIRDNGTGVANGEFARRLLAVGGSRKRGTAARGFRGVGRLAGLGYCQEVIFRSRAVGDAAVQELRWDCRAFKKLLSDHSYQGSLQDLISEVASVSESDGSGWPEHFYEVELVKPVRINSDLLLNREAISLYLSQTAPVPFSPGFRFGAAIREHLITHLGGLGEIDIRIDGAAEPLCRPYRDDYAYGEGRRDAFSEPEFRVIQGASGGVCAVVWLLHHGYHGAIPGGEGVNGLRARKGNVQIGDHRIFSDVFPEARFAAWTVGEVHVLDDRVVPNGRRDDFEQNAHSNHLVSRLMEIGDHIARMCRSSSVVRNRIKAFDIGAAKVEEQLTILEQGAVSRGTAGSIVGDIRSQMFEIRKAVEAPVLEKTDRSALSERYVELERRLSDAERTARTPAELAGLPEHDRDVVSRMIELIYECSANRIAAKSLVDRILARLGSGS